MAVRKVVRKKIAVGSKPKQKKAQEPQLQLSEISYEQVIVSAIIDGQDNEKVADSAMAFAASISALTPSLRKVTYNYGISVGRSVYRVFDRRKHYAWYGDSIQDMILFFDMVGYNYILYKILTEDLEVMIYRKGGRNLGCNIHSFDAGLISGFLGAARGNMVRVVEVACCNNGSDYCKFTTAPIQGVDINTKIEEVAQILFAKTEEKKIRHGYFMLNMEPLIGHEYSEQMGNIFAHMGGLVAGKLPQKLSGKMLQEASDIVDSAGLGRLECELKPLKIEMVFDGAKAKKEFVDISIRFLSGMLGRSGRKLNAQLYPAKKNSYKVVLKQ